MISFVFFYRYLPVISLIVFMIGFSIGFGCIPFLLMGELFPTAQRSLLSSLAGSFNLAVMFVVIKTYHPLEDVRSQTSHSTNLSNLTMSSITGYIDVWHLLDVQYPVCHRSRICDSCRSRNERTRSGNHSQTVRKTILVGDE